MLNVRDFSVQTFNITITGLKKSVRKQLEYGYHLMQLNNSI